MPTYKSYSRPLGTTSFRRKELNKEIESQLKLLIEFWALPENANKSWVGDKETQRDYYDFMLDKGFVEGDATKKDKDAREKTSGLVDLGLVTEDRRITHAGVALLKIVESNDFSSKNILGIPTDSYLYLRQVIKSSFKVNGEYVRPFLVVMNALCELGTLSYEEFGLLSLVINSKKKRFIFDSIRSLRNNTTNTDNIIWQILSSMENYQEAEWLFLNNPVTESLIMEIGMNRDGTRHDKPYYGLYKALIEVRKSASAENVLNLLNAVNLISKGCASYWKKLLFTKDRLSSNTIYKLNGACIKTESWLFSDDEIEFKKQFFKQLHLIKAKYLLDNYADLNKRILKTTNAVLFDDNTVKLDIIPHCYFDLMSNELDGITFTQEERLQTDIAIEEISDIFAISQADIVARARELYKVNTNNLLGVQNYIEAERYVRLNKMIDDKFTDENIVMLMTYFENRDDEKIQDAVTRNADIPTIFEYILAITWYKISGRQGKVLDYMNLSLDADLLPITHAAGGHEDITYKYEATEDYPAHTLLIEATLANSKNQRRMEMEPVSRHLGDYLLSHPEEDAYCVFATTFLHVNVVADFRMRKNAPYYSTNGLEVVNEMKIIPFQTREIKTIMQTHVTYAELYRIFEQAHQSIIAPNMWYQQEIVNVI